MHAYLLEYLCMCIQKQSSLSLWVLIHHLKVLQTARQEMSSDANEIVPKVELQLGSYNGPKFNLTLSKRRRGWTSSLFQPRLSVLPTWSRNRES